MIEVFRFLAAILVWLVSKLVKVDDPVVDLLEMLEEMEGG